MQLSVLFIHVRIFHPRSSDNIADLKGIELADIEMTESESSLIRPLSPIDWEAVGNNSNGRTEDKV